MSCVVAYVDNNETIYMAGDSAVFMSSDLSLRSLSDVCGKVFRKGDFLFGTVGSPRPGQILMSKFFCSTQ